MAVSPFERKLEFVRLGADLDPCDVAETDLEAVRLADDQVLELRDTGQAGLRAQEIRSRRAFDLACGKLEVVVAQRLADLVHGHVAGRHRVGLEPDPQGVGTVAVDVDRGDARQCLQPVGDEAVGVVGELGRRHSVRGHRHPDDRIALAVVLLDLGLLRLFGKIAGHRLNGGAHVRSRLVDVASLPEGDDGARAAELGLGRDPVDPGHGRDRALDHGGDLAVHDPRSRADILHADGHLGGARVGKFAHGHAGEAGDAEDDDQDRHHGGEHRAPQAEVRERHSRPSRETLSATSTGAPSRRLSQPVTTIRSPSSIPSVTSVSDPAEPPSDTVCRVACPSETV